MKVTERSIFKRCFFSSFLLIVSIITYSVPWGHWAYTLDTCPEYNCSCILYGKSYADNFVGGRIQYCQFVTIAQVPVFIISAVLACYHGYRVFIKTKKAQKKQATKSNPLLTGKSVGRAGKDDIILDTVPLDPEPDPPSYWISLLLFINALLVLILLVAIFATGIDGFYKSCEAYRKNLVRFLGVSGNIADVLTNRIQCPSVFDFMDYLQPDRKNYNEPYDYVRRDRINTGVCLVIAKFALTMNIVNWIYLSVFNFSKFWQRTDNRCCNKK